MEMDDPEDDGYRRALDRYQKELAEAKAKHPKACVQCGARGVIEWYSYGDRETPPDGGADPCSACTEQGNCPVCGEHSVVLIEGPHEDHFECPKCGYDESKNIFLFPISPEW